MALDHLTVSAVTLSFLIHTVHGDGIAIPSYCPYPMERMSDTDHCYHVRTDRKSWYDARDECTAAKSYLATIRSGDEYDFIFSRVLTSNCGQLKNTWFGLNDIASEGNFSYSNGESIGDWTQWHGAEPNNLEDGEPPADCVLIRGNADVWRDGKCENAHCFVCERSGLITKVKEVWLAGPEGDALWLVDGNSSSCVSMAFTAVPGVSQRCEVSYVYVRISDPAATQVKVQLLTRETVVVDPGSVPSCDTCGGGEIKVKMQQQRLVQGTSDAERFTGYYKVCEETGVHLWTCDCSEPPCDLIQVVIPPQLSHHIDICEVHFPDY